jgi:putrescine transport system permease protein
VNPKLFGKAWLAGGYLFLYLPIAALVIYSFNDSPLPNEWRGFTLNWYVKLASDTEMLGGFWLSLKIAFMTACASVVLGTLAAFALVKYKRFAGRTIFSGMVTAPLVMPEVIIGLSLLLMLVSVQRLLGFPERGMMTIWLGHLLLGLAYATVVVQARLNDLNPQLEEAALDLGARPWQVFMLVTLPMIAQALLSAWLLDAARHLLARAPGPEPKRERRRHPDRAGGVHRRDRRQPDDCPQRTKTCTRDGRSRAQLTLTRTQPPQPRGENR